MTIHVKFFAGLRERVGHDHLELEPAPGLDPAGAWRAALGETPMPDHRLCAVTMAYRPLDTPLADGDEVAFVPPVTGGDGGRRR